MADQKTLLKEIQIGNQKLSLFLENQAPHIECQSRTFSTVWHLVTDIQELSSISYLREFAEISNFFWKGNQFQFISSIPNYQVSYRTQVELEKKYPADLFEYRLTDFKIFDVSVMHDPKVENGQLTYYVYNTSNGLPYRVVCPFPYHLSASSFVHYQILPLLN